MITEFLLTTLAVFLLAHINFPVSFLSRPEPLVAETDLEYAKRMDFKAPVMVQYLRWTGGLFTGDLGESTVPPEYSHKYYLDYVK